MREKKIIRNLFVGGGILLVPAGVAAQNTGIWTMVCSDRLSLDCWALWENLWADAIFCSGNGPVWTCFVFCIQPAET